MLETKRVDQLQNLMGEIVRVGTVSSTSDADATARVQFADRDDVVSYDLPVLVRNTLQNKDYWMPDIGEQVLCLFLPIGIEQGYILGSFYSQVTRPAVTTKDKRRVDFGDGAWVEYDRAASLLNINCPGDVVVNTVGSATINADTTTITSTTEHKGDVTIAGNLAVSGKTTTGALTSTGAAGSASIAGNLAIENGDITADGYSVKKHYHLDDAGNPTGEAQQ